MAENGGPSPPKELGMDRLEGNARRCHLDEERGFFVEEDKALFVHFFIIFV